MFFQLHGCLWIARKFVQAHGNRLTKVHRTMLFASGNAQEPMAMAEVFIRKATLLRTEEQGDRAAG